MITALFNKTGKKVFGLSKSFGYLNMDQTKGVCIHIGRLSIIFSKVIVEEQSQEVKEFHSKLINEA